MCNKCEESFSLDDFHKDKSKKDGHRGECKLCAKIIDAKKYTKNKERLCRLKRIYYRKNKKAHVSRVLNRKYLKKVNGTGLTNKQWDEILNKYNHRCAYCGVQGNMTRDHVIPLGKGGEHSPHNIVPACSECNDRKGVELSWEPRIFKNVC